MTPTTQDLLRADEIGLKLEVMNDLPMWEAMPSYRHQKHVARIAQSMVRPAELGCECVVIQDVYVQFPNGLKRPDIAILCREPDDADQDPPLRTIPEAVVEVVSKGYEAKDLQIGPTFYLSQGVKDVLVFDPATLLVLHVTASTDLLFPPVAVRGTLAAAGTGLARYVEMDTAFGHQASGPAHALWSGALQDVLDSTAD